MAMIGNSQHYEAKGWDRTKPGWHKKVITVKTQDSLVSVLKWLVDNIDNCERHCRWATSWDGSAYVFSIKFRHERDYIWFNLTWG